MLVKTGEPEFDSQLSINNKRQMHRIVPATPESVSGLSAGVTGNRTQALWGVGVNVSIFASPEGAPLAYVQGAPRITVSKGILDIF